MIERRSGARFHLEAMRIGRCSGENQLARGYKKRSGDEEARLSIGAGAYNSATESVIAAMATNAFVDP